MGRQPRVLRTAAVAAIASAGVFVFAPLSVLADPAHPQSAADCRALTDFAQRGACWDALDQANQQDKQIEKKRDFGLGLHLPSVSAIKPKAEKVARLADEEKAELKNLTLTVSQVDDSPLGRLIMTSTDGAVWEQTDGDPVNQRPEPGDTVEVSKGFMGGYLCKLTRWQSVRCQRDQ
jgi:hypothetical protein